MKRKLLFVAALAVSALGFHANAQKDVTSDYLKNYDFSLGTPLTGGVSGYGRNMSAEGNSLYGLQPVQDWNIMIVNGDNGDEYPNSSMAGGMFAYGGDPILNNKTKAPEAGPNESAGNCLGFAGLWQCGGYYYQDVELEAGPYKITIPVYNQAGDNAGTSYTGFIADNGTKYVGTPNISIGSWNNLEIEFLLLEKTPGRIALGFVAGNVGSGGTVHLFYDAVKLEDVSGDETYKKYLDEYVAKANAITAIPQQAKDALDAVVKENSKDSYASVTEFVEAIAAIQKATADAEALVAPYAAYQAAKKNIDVIAVVETTVDNTSRKAEYLDALVAEAEAATTPEALNAVVARINPNILAYIKKLTPKDADNAPFDLTFMITNPSFDDSYNGWTCNPAPNPGNNQTQRDAHAMEYFEKTFDIYQELNDMPTGSYRLNVKAFQRPGGANAVVPAYVNAEDKKLGQQM